jgi:hypothetical protein
MSQYGPGGQQSFGQTPPGWYPDPNGYGQRWWDGLQWAPSTPPGPPAAYQAPPAAYPTSTGTNGLAIAGMVLGILWLYWLGSILAVVFGHVALRQISRSGQGGRGMAIAALVLGYLGLAIGVVAIVLVAVAVHHSNAPNGVVGLLAP